MRDRLYFRSVRRGDKWRCRELNCREDGTIGARDVGRVSRSNMRGERDMTCGAGPRRTRQPQARPPRSTHRVRASCRFARAFRVSIGRACRDSIETSHRRASVAHARRDIANRRGRSREVDRVRWAMTGEESLPACVVAHAPSACVRASTPLRPAASAHASASVDRRRCKRKARAGVVSRTGARRGPPASLRLFVATGRAHRRIDCAADRWVFN